MAKNYYLPKDDSGKAELLEHLAARLPIYAEALEVSPADLASLQADAAAFRYTLTSYNAVHANAKLWTSFKSLQRDGGSGSTAFPHAPNLPAPVPAVPLGIIPRLTALVARMKTARNYTEAIGQDLKIVGTEQIIDPNAWKPIIDLASEAGHPIIKWPKGDADAIEIWADRGDNGGFSLAAVTTAPAYTDASAKPAAGAVWRYKAIYRLRDAQVGQWSDVVSVAVGS